MLQGLLLIAIIFGTAVLIAIPIGIIFWIAIKRNVNKQIKEQENGTFKLD